MRCPKCHYISFGSLERCRNCGYDLALAPSAESQSIDLPIHGDDQPIGPLGDFALSERAPAAVPAPAPSSDQASSAIGRRAAALARLELPLFSDRGAAEDAPLVSAPAVPRTPLSVRRAAPAIVRTRPESLDQSDAEQQGSARTQERRARARSDDRHADGSTAADAGRLVTAPVVRRLLAGLIDVLILAAIDGGVIYSTLRFLDLPYTAVRILPAAPMSVFFILLNGGYLAMFTTAGGQTIGKMIAGIRVVTDPPDADANLRAADLRVPLGSAVLRASAYLVSLLPAGLGFLPILAAADGRALHDRLAGTRVVKA